MARLIADILRRQVRTYAACAAVAAYLWYQAPLDHPAFSLSATQAGSMLLAYACGWLVALAGWRSREYAMLPLSARQLWRTRWMVAAVLPTFAVAAGAVVGIGVDALAGSPIDLDRLTLSMTLNVACCGVGFTMCAFAGQLASKIQGSHASASVAGATAAVVLVTLVALVPAGPLVTLERWPVQWSALSVPAAAALLAALAIAAAGFFRTVRVPAGGGQPLSAVAADLALPTRKGVVGPFAGATRLAWAVSVEMLVTLVLMIGGLLLLNGQSLPDYLVGFFERGPFDSAVRILAIAWVIGWWGERLEWGPIAVQPRLLRVLPLSTAGVNAMRLVPVVISWLLVWAVMLAGYALAAGHWPNSPRLGALSVLLGFSALGRALASRSLGPLIAGFVLLMLAGILARIRPALAQQPLEVLAGLVLLGAAWWLGVYVLTHRRSLYNAR